jgi:hypothetical protein
MTRPELPTKPGFYWCRVRAIVSTRKGSREPKRAIIEVVGEAPYLRAYVHAYQECNEITAAETGLLLSVGDRIAHPGDPR